MNGQLDVLHVVTSSAFAGIERHVLRLAANLRSHGCLATIACPADAAPLREGAEAVGVPVAPLTGESGGGAWTIAAQVRRSRHAVIHSHDGKAAAITALAVRPSGPTLVRTQHFSRPASVERAGLRSSASIAAHRAINMRLAGYIAVSESVAAEARSRAETRGARVAVIPPGIRLPSEATVAKARSLRAQAERPTIALIARLEPEKKIHVLIEALPRVREGVGDARVLIAGTGSVEHELKEQAHTLDVADMVEWLGWVREPDEVLRQADLFVSTIAWEGFGMAMAEAMAEGLPVVAADSGASSELVDEGVTGRLVPPGDAAAYAAAICELLADRPRAQRMGSYARARAIRDFGELRTAQLTAEFYEQLAGSGG